MESFYTFCHLYHKDNNIPIYLYQNEKLCATFPEQTDLTSPPEKYSRILFNSPASVSYCASEYGVYFGAVRCHGGENKMLVLGPVSTIPYSLADLHRMYADYTVPSRQRGEFQLFLQTIPSVSLLSLVDKLIFLNYCLNQEMITAEDVITDFDSGHMSGKVMEDSHIKQDIWSGNESYKIESVVMNLVRTGNLGEMKKIRFNEASYHIGVIAPSALRQIRNNIIVLTTLVTRAAIEGGLDYDVAYKLSDLYIQTAERLDKSDDLYSLMRRLILDFTQRVQECKVPLTMDDVLQRAVRYVQQNVGNHVTAAEVSNYVGFSRAYFSTYFKSQLGFSISSFILRCKLEESRRLLQFTTKSLADISNYLCFSSQSHYQTAFKKQYGVTPLQYRKNPCLREE